jgi:2-C-methyl-D-erythritol 4-phosphate cytidylyltransferase
MNIAIILSGGIGSRMGANIPKQYLEVNNRPIIRYAVEKFLAHDDIDCMIIALNEQWKDYVKSKLPNSTKKIYFSEPGETRQHTIYNALRKAKSIGGGSDDVVIIHDAVRPLVSNRVIKDCLDGCKIYDAAIATIDVKDTIYVCKEGVCITDAPNRSLLHAGQTPEAFKLGQFLRIHDESSYEEISNVTGGAQFATQKGLQVFLSRGEEINFKITTPEDLDRFKQVISNR